MTTYELPAMPDVPLWDRNGERWEPPGADNLWVCLSDKAHMEFYIWSNLLEEYGPLTDTPTITREQGNIMNQEQELARIIEGAILGRTATDGAREAAEKILAAGYHKYRVIGSWLELDGLAPGTLLRLPDDHYTISEATVGGNGWHNAQGTLSTSATLWEKYDGKGDILALWEPGT